MILWLLLTPLVGYSQTEPPIVISYKNQTRYCLNETQALLVIELHRTDGLLRGKINALTGKVELLEMQLIAKDTILNASNELLDIEGERLSLNKKELRKAKRKAVSQWFRDKWQTLVIASGAFGVGVAVGIGAGL